MERPHAVVPERERTHDIAGRFPSQVGEANLFQRRQPFAFGLARQVLAAPQVGIVDVAIVGRYVEVAGEQHRPGQVEGRRNPCTQRIEPVQLHLVCRVAHHLAVDRIHLATVRSGVRTHNNRE